MKLMDLKWTTLPRIISMSETDEGTACAMDRKMHNPKVGANYSGVKSNSKIRGETRLDLVLCRWVTQDVYRFRHLAAEVKTLILFSGEVVLAYECVFTEVSNP
jgi:hypothetical protein